MRIPGSHARKITVGRPLQGYRQYRSPGFGRDKGRAFVDLHQSAGNGDSAFREDDHRPALADQADYPLHGHRVGGIHGDVIHKEQQQAEHALLGYARVDDKDRVERQEEAQEQTIQKGLMVADDEEPVLRDLLVSVVHLHPEEYPAEHAKHSLEQAVENGKTVKEGSVG